MRTLPLPFLLALALGTGCGQHGDALPAPPATGFHFPQFMAAVGQGVASPTLIVDSSDIDGAFRSGTLLSVSSPPAYAPLGTAVEIAPNTTDVRIVQDAPAVLKGFDEPTASECATGPTLFVGANSTTTDVRDGLYMLDVVNGMASCPGGDCRFFRLLPQFATTVWPVAVSCPPGGTRRVWVGFLQGQSNNGYVGQLDWTQDPTRPFGPLIEVNVGQGGPQAFAFDADWNRLYFVTREVSEASFLRWIDPGVAGCKSFPDDAGLQDETRGGCHVDSGVSLSQFARGAEGADVRLGTQVVACETPVEANVMCRKAYLGIRIYDADLAAASGTRPSVDIGGQLWVMEIPQTPNRPDPRLLRRFDVGNGVARIQVIPRTALGKPDLVAIVSREDDQLWIYDEATRAIALGVGRDRNGVPLLGHDLVGLAAVQQTSGIARLYVSAMSDHWVSAVDVDLADPTLSYVVRQGAVPTDQMQPILHILGTLQ